MTDPLVLLGEVRTALLPNCAALAAREASALLSLLPGQRVTMRERPLPLAISPRSAVGVDCRVATTSTKETRAIGTVAAHAVLVGGRVAQSSAGAVVVRAQDPNRRPWNHYLTRVGTLEVWHRMTEDAAAAIDLTSGFLEKSGPATLDLGSISDRLLTRVRTDRRLDQDPPVRSAATRLRWAARVAPPLDGSARGRAFISFRLEDETTRSVLVLVPTVRDLEAVQRFCEDLAVHDWLLSVLGAALAEADRPTADRDAATQLSPLLEQLVHLWMPGAHSAPRLSGLWERLEQNPGFTRQWTAQVGQLRDRLAVATLAALRSSKISTIQW
ncbi:SCO2521 family protein [Nocardia yunnanensis]|nr:SCO2521 family protein [Nocardia yunnanensis]